MARRTVFVLVVSLLSATNAESPIPGRYATSALCAISRTERQGCGAEGTREADCLNNGCCWNPCHDCGHDVPWCFMSTDMLREECQVPSQHKTDCGFYGITEPDCLSRGCCWLPSPEPNDPWCFVTDIDLGPSTSPPEVGSEGQVRLVTIPEELPVGTLIPVDMGVTDSDPGETRTFYLANTPYSSYFYVNSITSQLTVARSMDLDSGILPQPIPIEMIVSDKTGLQAKVDIFVTLTDINDHPPFFTDGSEQTLTFYDLLKYDTKVTRLYAKDLDQGLNGKYSFQMSQSSGDHFKLNNSRDIWVKNELKMDESPAYIWVTVQDYGTPARTDTTILTIRVVDRPPTFSEENTNIRLVNGDSSYSGRVEVYHQESWGTVCDDGWDDTDAKVVCRQLGFAGGMARLGADFGAGEGSIWLDEVACNGMEETLETCLNNGWGNHDCSHNEDAGVVCVPDDSVEIGSEDCKISQLGKEYMGDLSVTKYGRQCQRWNSQSPHEHTRNRPEMFPDMTLEDAVNFCRNPDDEPEGPWCYTTDPDNRWEYCDIPFCPVL